MTAMETPKPDGRAPGPLSKALIRLLMKPAIVVVNECMAGNFRLITLEGPALEGVAWMPGQKVQIAMGSAFATRTYTPIEWNAATGRACILGYAHGDGLGSAWLRTVEPGDGCDVFGPRSSLDLSRLSGPIAIFGDETSIGLAHAAVHQITNRPVACHFEVDDMEAARDLTAQLGLRDTALFERRGGDAHIEAMAAGIPALALAGATFVLTGRAGTIQVLRRTLKQHAIPPARVVAKAYWTPGKTGLD